MLKSSWDTKEKKIFWENTLAYCVRAEMEIKFFIILK